MPLNDTAVRLLRGIEREPMVAIEGTSYGPHHGKDALRSIVAEVWESEGAATLYLTLDSVSQPIAGNPAAVFATSTLLIVAPGAPPQLQSVCDFPVGRED